MRERLLQRLGPASGLAFAATGIASAVTTDLYDPAIDPHPGRSAETLARLFEAKRDQLRISAYLTLLAAFFVLAFTAWLREVLTRRGGSRWPATLVLGGGATASALLLVEVAFVLAAHETTAYADAPEVAKTWFVLSWNYANVFAPPALAVVGGATLAALGTGALPRWLLWAGGALTALVVVLIAANMPGVAVAVFVVWALIASLTLLVRPPADDPRR